MGLLDGSVSYLFSTVPLHNTPSKSGVIPLRKLVPGYRQIECPVTHVRGWGWDSILGGRSGYSSDATSDPTRKATLLHATLHLPAPSTLTALFLRRISPSTKLSLALCSSQGPPPTKFAPQASLLAQISHDTGKYCNEYLFSTDNALFGWRGLWNLGPITKTDKNDPTSPKASSRLSLLSAGGEAYYSPLSSLVGLSTGLRFTTLPAASSGLSPVSSFPYTLSLTLTPLTGSLLTSYSLRASPNLAFSSRFGFNVYSWESEMVAGCEIWRCARRIPPQKEDDGLEWARRKMRGWKTSTEADSGDAGTLPHPLFPTLSVPDSSAELFPSSSSSPVAPKSEHLFSSSPLPYDPPSLSTPHGDSVIKIRVDQSWNFRILWEGRVKELLVTAGVSLGPSSFISHTSGGDLTSSSAAAVSSAVSASGLATGIGSGSGSTSQSAGGGNASFMGPPKGSSYWRGFGVSILYSS